MTTPATSPLTGDLAQTSVGTGTETQVIGLQEWTIDRKLKTLDATTTDSGGDEVSLPSTRSWTASAKYVYLDADPSQAAQILNAIANAQTAVQWNFFPDAVLGRGAWKGLAFVDSYKLAGGVGKVFGVDITLKGTGPLTFTTQIAPVANQAEV